MSRTSLRDVLSTLSQSAREALTTANPHLREEWDREQQAASGSDARVVVEDRSVVVTLDGMRLMNESNLRESWHDRERRAKRQKRAVMGALANTSAPHGERFVVAITRLGARWLETAEVVNSGRHVREAVEAWFRTSDRSSCPVEWRVNQRRSSAYGVTIRIDGFDADTVDL